MKLSPVEIPSRPAGLRVEALRVSDARFTADAQTGLIEVYDSIGDGGVTPAKISAALRAIGPKPITVAINSPGGLVHEGFAIFNLLRGHGADVTTRIDGLAASAAAVIAMAGDTVEAARASQLMIHRAQGMAAGNADTFDQVATALRKIDSVMTEIFVARTGLPAGEIARMLSEETFLDASEAVELGFVDRLLSRDAVPSPRVNASAAPTDKRSLEEFLRSAGLTRSVANRAATAAFRGGESDLDLEKIAAVVTANTAAIQNLR